MIRSQAHALLMERLRLEPQRADDWLLLARLLGRDGHSTAARTAYAAALHHHCAEPVQAHLELANLLLDAGDAATAATHYRTALALEPDNAAAHQGLSAACDLLGDTTAAELHRRTGFGAQPVIRLPAAAADATTLIVLASAWHGNLPWRRLVDTHRFQVTIVCVEFLPATFTLPRHTPVLNAIGDADLCRDGLLRAQQLCAAQTQVLNLPQHVLRTGRADTARRLSDIGHVRTAPVTRLHRSQTTPNAWPDTLPRERSWLVRAPGFQGGEHFIRIDPDTDTFTALAGLPGDHWLVMPFIDTRCNDGLYRKYRMLSIGGRLYPLHLAVSTHWKVHYFSATARTDQAIRAEEARFLTDPAALLPPHALLALHAIQHMQALDYCGIDFALDADGELVVFETNATMAINPPPDEAADNPRAIAARHALQAAHDLLDNAACRALDSNDEQ